MAEPNDMIMPMLREMRAETADFRASIEQRMDKIDRRLHNLAASQSSYRQALVADTMMSKFMVGDFEERIHALEDKVDALTKKR